MLVIYMCGPRVFATGFYMVYCEMMNMKRYISSTIRIGVYNVKQYFINDK